jgi:RNA polymerase-associated protein CTR9
LLIHQDARRAEIEKRAAELAEQRRQAAEEARLYQEEVARRTATDMASKQSRSDRVLERKRRKEAGEELDPEDVKPRRKKGGKRNKRSKSEISSEGEAEDGSESRSRSGTVGEEGEGVDPEQVRRERLEKIKADRKRVSVSSAICDIGQWAGG